MVFVSRIKTIFFVHHMFTQFQVLPLGAAGPCEWAGRKAGLQVNGNAGGQEGMRVLVSVFGVGRASTGT